MLRCDNAGSALVVALLVLFVVPSAINNDCRYKANTATKGYAQESDTRDSCVKMVDSLEHNGKCSEEAI